jgi:predicted kinase
MWSAAFAHPVYAISVRQLARQVGRNVRHMLYIFGGLPGTGKSTLSQHLARYQQAVHLRIDTIEQAFHEAGTLINGPEGYVVAYRIAADNLRLGLSVVADSVNPLQITRAAWRDVATQSGVAIVEIEVVCSNEAEHRARVTTRSTNISGLRLPTWAEVRSRVYEPWDTEHIVIDTAGQTVEQSIAALERALASR